MSLVVASTSNSAVADPTIELQIALKEFELALAEDQRKVYNASVSKPDHESVTLFVADVAARNQGPRGKFLWKRLCPFLEATRQFTGIVNTFVSSNPSIAALVWGGVRTTILAAENVSSYFAEVMNLLMEIGRLSPTLTEFGQLYTGHIGLQHALCKYYTVVVRICIKIMKSVQRTMTSHIMSTFFNPFQAEFKPMLDDLAAMKQSIRDQISLAAKQAAAESSKLLEFESKENETHRRLASKFRLGVGEEHRLMEQWRSKQLQIQSRKKRDRLLKQLSEIDYYKAWRLALHPRVSGTADWFQNDSGFRDWQSQRRSARIWCRGTMGSGKTVITSNVVSYLLKHKTAEDVVAFHFCRSDEEASLKVRAIIGTLARQILNEEVWKLEDDALNDLLKKSQSSDFAVITDLILRNLKEAKVYYMIIDGLDECHDEDIFLVNAAVTEFCKTMNIVVKVFYSTRPDIERTLFGKPPEYKLILSPIQIQTDIDTYVDSTLDRYLEDGTLKLVDPTLILKIAKILKEGSKGMFLWVLFLIGELCSCSNDHEMTEALDHPPEGLSKMLDTIVTRIKSQKSAPHTMRMLEYCGVAKRPLSMYELQEALSLTKGQQSLDRTKMPTDMYRIASDCRGLVFVDEVEDTIHYIHHSLKAFLFNRADDSASEFQAQTSDLQLGYMCLTYMEFNEFQRQITKSSGSSDMKIAPSAIGLSTLLSSSKVAGRIARKLLSRQSDMQNLSLQDLSRKAQEILKTDGFAHLEQTPKDQMFQFLKYASMHWFGHLSTLRSQSDPDIWSLFSRIVNSNSPLAVRPWSQTDIELGDTTREYGRPPTDRGIRWALINWHPTLLTVRLGAMLAVDVSEYKNDVEFVVSWTMTRPEYWDEGRALAEQLRYYTFLAIFMHHITNSEDMNPIHFLLGCKFLGQHGLVPMLGPDPPWKPLTVLAREERWNALYLLLDATPDLIFSQSDQGNALLWAAYYEREPAVLQLLRAVHTKTDVNFANEDGITALICAIHVNNIGLVSILLEADADANKTDNNGLSPLMHIIYHEPSLTQLIEELVDAGADVNHQNRDGYSVLLNTMIVRAIEPFEEEYGRWLYTLGNTENVLQLMSRYHVDADAATIGGLTAIEFLEVARAHHQEFGDVTSWSKMGKALTRAGVSNKRSADRLSLPVLKFAMQTDIGRAIFHGRVNALGPLYRYICSNHDLSIR